MAEQVKEFRDLVRIADKDVDGNTSIFMAMTHVKGVDFMMANAICGAMNLNKTEKTGNFSPEEIEKIEEAMEHPEKYEIPKWLFNHRKDLETGEDKHFIASDLTLQNQMDIKFIKKIRSYKGMRHTKGSKKVRGQKTRTTGRRGATLGVARKKKGQAEGAAKKATAAAEAKDKKK
ncbi:MAG: 30S ribosomal protein S13 [DPANN group archaeon]|nr:30S ribosomal protein S13 [DPANN group archaeon]